MKNVIQKENVYYINNDYAMLTPTDVHLCDQVRNFETNYSEKFDIALYGYENQILGGIKCDLNLHFRMHYWDVIEIMMSNFDMSLSELKLKYTEYFETTKNKPRQTKKNKISLKKKVR